MKFALKVIILFLIVFNLRIPYFYNTVFFAVFITTLYYFYKKKSIPFTYFSYRYIVTVILATFGILLVVFLISTYHETEAVGTTRRLLIQFSMLCALIYALPLFFERKTSEAYEDALLIIVCAFALQGFIHLMGYVIPPFGEFLISIKPQGFQDLLNDPKRNVDRFRGYAFSGTTFFELPSAYGAAFIVYIRLLLMKGQQYLVGYKSYIMLVLIVIGIMLTGRIGFVGIGIGLIFYFIFVPDPILILSRIFKATVVFLPVILVVYFIVLSPWQQRELQTDILPYAFEFFYNFAETGRFGTWSSDVTFKAFYYPLRDETLLLGHGTENIYSVLHMYPFTDAGYMKNLLFGGIPYLSCLIIYQFLYFSKPIFVSFQNRDSESKIDRYFFFCLFAHILAVHIKDLALGVQHLTEVLFLFVGISYMVKYYAKIEK
jgi:hypothetical protein